MAYFPRDTDINVDLQKPITGGAPAAVGGAALLVDEANGFAADFTYATDANRVAVKVSSVVTEYGLDSFFANAGTSPKQVYDVTGALVWSPHNMVLQSENFAATWTTTNLTATAHTLDDANAAAAGAAFQSITTITGETYTVTVWILKDAITTRYPALEVTSSTIFRVGLDTSAGTKWEASTGLVGTSTATSAGAYWRLTATFAALGTSCFLRIYPAFTTVFNGTLANAALGSITVDKVQFNRGSTPTAYIPTTTAARYGLAVDYDPATHSARGLLCEPAATNLLLQSSAFTTSWTLAGGMTVTSNVVVAPNGLTEGDAIVPVSGPGVGYITQVGTVVAATTYTLSAYVKNGTLGNNWLDFSVVSTTTWRAWFNLATGAKGSSVGSPTSYNITSMGNGWYRIDMTVVAGTTTASCYFIPCPADGSLAAITGDGTSPALYAWGAQLETGSVATSPIPTYAASVTRAVDAYTCASAAINHSATAGSWWTENYQIAASAGGSGRVIGYAFSASAPTLYNSTPAFAMHDTAGSFVAKAPASMFGVIHKTASAWAAGDRAITANGLAVATDAGTTTNLLAPGTTIYFGNMNGAVSPMTGYIRKLFYLPRRMSNAELVTKTT